MISSKKEASTNTCENAEEREPMLLELPRRSLPQRQRWGCTSVARCARKKGKGFLDSETWRTKTTCVCPKKSEHYDYWVGLLRPRQDRKARASPWSARTGGWRISSWFRRGERPGLFEFGMMALTSLCELRGPSGQQTMSQKSNASIQVRNGEVPKGIGAKHERRRWLQKAVHWWCREDPGAGWGRWGEVGEVSK